MEIMYEYFELQTFQCHCFEHLNRCKMFVQALLVADVCSMAFCTFHYYDMPVTLTNSWLPYPPDQPFWYSDQNSLSCQFFFPRSGGAQLVCFMYPGSIGSGGFLITSRLTLVRIQGTAAVEMISHHFTWHELCDLLSAILLTLDAQINSPDSASEA